MTPGTWSEIGVVRHHADAERFRQRGNLQHRGKAAVAAEVPSEFGFGMAKFFCDFDMSDSWHCCNGHDVRNCRSNTTARDEV